MKATRTVQSGFTPFSLIITVESAEEARALWAIFNHTRNTRLLPSKTAPQLRQAIGPEHEAYGEIANGVAYGEFYR